MAREDLDFWEQINTLHELDERGLRPAAQTLFDSLWKGATEAADPSPLTRNRQDLLGDLAQSFDFHIPKAAAAPGLPEMAAISAEALPGISLVTCCMNRSENLLNALRSWMACPEIDEILIVDWSSDQPVAQALQAAGMSDPRLRILRVEDEPRWVLSYAFNAGFRLARHAQILKADADIVLTSDFFARNPLRSGQFIAGNWRNASAGQEHINGFFFVHKSDLAAVGGFNEFITTYGWDDDDLYSRIEQQGLTRIDVDPETLHHQDHSDVERTGQQGARSQHALDMFQEDMLYHIRRNRFIANVMPVWAPDCPPIPFALEDQTPAQMRAWRQAWLPSVVPDHVSEDADHYALMELASWNLEGRLREVPKAQLPKLLQQPKADIGRLEVEVALSTHPDHCVARRYLVIDLPDDRVLMSEAGDPDGLLQQLLQGCKQHQVTPVLRADHAQLPQAEAFGAYAYVPIWENIDPCTDLAPDQLIQIAQPDAPRHLRITFEGATSAALATGLETLTRRDAAPLKAPQLAPGRGRLFIDAQHGLGNRMRAIGSAAALAEASDRELVVVWQPDHHCEGRLSDLYDYDGAVIEEAFVETAAAQGARVYNYMEVEAGGVKDVEIDLSGSADIYARAAYVLKAPASTWDSENTLLKQLRPVAAVRDLVASVRRPNDLSAHVRMVGGSDFEHLSYESLDNWTEEGHAETEKWRKRSHFSHFLKRIDTLIAEGRADRIFLAADKPETYEAFLTCYGDRVAYLPRELYDRSAAQLQYALADAMLLGSSPLLLGSTWSSFSELAMRLSPQKMQIEMSGTDF